MAKPTRPPVTFIDSPTKARRHAADLAAILAKKIPVATDTEFEPDTDEIALMSYGWDSYGDRFVVEGPLVAEFYGEHLTNPESRFVYQNYGADADVFYGLNLQTDASFYADTMVMGWLVDENLVSHGLKEQSFHFLKWRRQPYDRLFAYIPEGKKMPVVMTPKQVLYDLPPEACEYALIGGTKQHGFKTGPRTGDEWRKVMLDYSGDDAASTIALYHKHRRFLKEIGYWDNYLKFDRPFTLTLMRCEERGVRISLDRMREILRLVNIRIMRAQHGFRALSGKPDFNINSDPQLKKLMLDELNWPTRDDLQTPSGYPSLGKEAMNWYLEEFLGRARALERKAARSSAPEKLIRRAETYRRYYSLALLKNSFKREAVKRGTFLEGIINGLDPETDRLHSHFNQIGADTGRISSRKQRKKITITYTTRRGEVKTREKMIKVGANLQNIPSRKEKDPDGIRGAFEAPLCAASRRAIAEMMIRQHDPEVTDAQVAHMVARITGDVTAHGYVAQEDYTLIVADYSGFELCMAIFWLHEIGQHKSKMLKTMQEQKSPSAVHALTAMGMYGEQKPAINVKNENIYREVLVPKYGEKCRLKHLKMEDWKLVKVFWPDFYGMAKNGNFNLLYGGSPQMMARLRGQDVRDPEVISENEEFVSNWNHLYPEIGEYQDYMVNHGYEHGWVPTISGRRANVKELLASEDKGIRSHGERKCMNTPCQGSAADIVKVAMNLIERDEVLRDTRSVITVRKAKKRHKPPAALRDRFGQPWPGSAWTMSETGVWSAEVPAVALLFPVHDEIVVEAPLRYADQVMDRVAHLMKQPFKERFPFELDVEAKHAPNWLAAKG